jgi:hypothetical protein
MWSFRFIVVLFRSNLLLSFLLFISEFDIVHHGMKGVGSIFIFRGSEYTFLFGEEVDAFIGELSILLLSFAQGFCKK